MSYRVETALSARAGCTATECKNAGVKIDKDELRLGTWVEFEERGSWKWKHWGCVSGKIMQNLRKNLDPEGTGNYNWEALDGYEGDEKNSLDKSPDLQAKVRRCIEQGFIDPDDFNGDPEMNRLGETGLRTKESKKKMREDTITNKNRVEELEAEKAALQAQLDALAAQGKSDTKLEIKIEAAQDEIDAANKGGSPVKAAQKAAAKKRAREEENDGEEKKPAKRKRAIKKRELDSDGEEIKPVRKPRTKKAKKEPSPSPSLSPTPSDVPGLVDSEEDPEAEVMPAPSKRARGRKSNIKKDPDNEDMDFEDEIPVVEKKKRVSRGRTRKVKDEPADEDMEDELAEQVEYKPAPSKRRGRKAAVKKEELDEERYAVPGEGSSDAALADDTIDTTVHEDLEPVIRVKGEPMEEGAGPTDFQEYVDEDEDEEDVKPRRGRVKKETITPRRGRGRPRTKF